jgi:hypothetical protein
VIAVLQSVVHQVAEDSAIVSARRRLLCREARGETARCLRDRGRATMLTVDTATRVGAGWDGAVAVHMSERCGAWQVGDDFAKGAVQFRAFPAGGGPARHAIRVPCDFQGRLDRADWDFAGGSPGPGRQRSARGLLDRADRRGPAGGVLRVPVAAGSAIRTPD